MHCSLVFLFFTLLFQYVVPQTCSPDDDTCIPQCKSTTTIDVVVVGAGISGLSLVKRLHQDGFTVHAFEEASDLGGTWYFNAYPGSRCDVESSHYHIKDKNLRQNWDWKEKYATQGDILEHVREFARINDLRRHVTFNTKVEHVIYDDVKKNWMVYTSSHDCWEAQFVALATGILSTPYHPKIVGKEKFKGDIYYSFTYPHTHVDFKGKRVGIVGTGSSGVQMIPVVAENALQLTVFQKSPQYVVPLRNIPKDPSEDFSDEQNFDKYWENILNTYPSGIDTDLNRQTFDELGEEKYRNNLESRWEKGGFFFIGGSSDLFTSQGASNTIEKFIREKIYSTVKNPRTAELLSPDYSYVCKRPLMGTNYYETYNRENVHLHSLAEAPISEFTENGIKTADGTEHFFDIIIMATGFDLFGSPLRIDIRGKGGQTLRQKWSENPDTYIGIQTVNFPNLFLVAQIGSAAVFSNVIGSIEHHVQFIGDMIVYMRKNQKYSVEPSEKAERDWTDHLLEVADKTLYTKPGCYSAYLGSNIPGKPRRINGYLGFRKYVEKVNEVGKNYEGFIFS